jgi:NhaP-type Na+/H+ or K+/H+ antiporter
MWALAAGIVVGWVCGKGVGWAVLYIRREFKAGHEWEEFLALGLIVLSYGVAAFVYGNGFLAVLTAGLALRRIETDLSATKVPPRDDEPLAWGEHVKATPAYMVRTVLGFNQSLERIGELVVVLALGVCMSTLEFDKHGVLLALLLFVVIRPLATWLGLIGCRYTMHEFRLISWFGVRGAGSFYYLMYVIANGAPAAVASELLTIVLTVVSISVVVHGISATPLMKLKPKVRRRRPKAV